MDIISSKPKDDEQHDDAVYTGKEGKYISVKYISVTSAEEDDSTKYMNGLLSSETEGDFDKLHQIQQSDNIKELENEEEAVSYINTNLPESVDSSMDIEQLEINCEETGQTTDKHSTDMEDRSRDQDQNHQKEESEDKEEERDLYSDGNRNIIHFQKYISKPRHSLDSQLELLPKCSPKVVSLDSLSEDGDNELRGVHEQEHLNAQQKKKSISWASDLETIHEFHRIKGRRLSLSALFKKY